MSLGSFYQLTSSSLDTYSVKLKTTSMPARKELCGVRRQVARLLLLKPDTGHGICIWLKESQCTRGPHAELKRLEKTYWRYSLANVPTTMPDEFFS